MLPSTVARLRSVTTPSITWYTMAPALIPVLDNVTVIGFLSPSIPFIKLVSGTVAVAPVP